MACKIIYKASANQDLQEITEYLFEYSAQATVKFLKDVKSRIEILAAMPKAGSQISPFHNYRKMVVGDYVIVYLFDKHSEDVVIFRIVHGRRNYITEPPFKN